MNLWYESCCCLHYFTDSGVERIVYALEASARDDPSRVRPGEADCLESVLGDSHDSEVWVEHVDASVECRKRLGKLRGGTLRAHYAKGAGIRRPRP